MRGKSDLFRKVAVVTAMAAIAFASPAAEDIVLVDNGTAKAAVYVPEDIMAPNAKITKEMSWKDKESETQRQRLRESVNDLVLYIEKISGAKLDVVKNQPEAGDTRFPILIGKLAEKKFGAPKVSFPYKQGFRVTVSPDGIGLSGESDLAASYAVYELLERLGCRWYMPSGEGEVVPARKTISLASSDKSLAPGTIYRGIWYGDDAFKRRTRQGGLLISAGHALEISNFIPKEKLEQNPEWCGLVNGKRTASRYCWASGEAADAVADGIIRMLDKNYVPTLSLSPNDGADFCECEKCKALDAGDFDDSIGMMSITDRYISFCNRIAERVTKKYPDVLFGFLAYVQYTRPPVREKLHPNLVPQIAPITYCRAHTALQSDMCPSRAAIKKIAEGWGKKSGTVSYYNYMFHLAEVTVPYPMIRQMSDELPILYGNNITFWQPETLSNFESVLPGMVIAMRMSWDTKAKPADILNEFYALFYGSAEKPMRRYWQIFDDAWTKTPEHAGCAFGYLRRFTPEVLADARSAMNEAIAACRTEKEIFRVGMQNEALKQFELFMKLRRDFAEGRFTDLGAESAKWMEKQLELGKKYAPQSAFTPVGWTPLTVGGGYFTRFFKLSYDDAARMAKDHTLILLPRRLRYQADKDRKGESLGWNRPDFDDSGWKTTAPAVDTWFSLGLETYYGAMFYRSTVRIPAVPAGKKVYLWISSTDGTAKVFVNGRHVGYVDAKGKKSDEFSGYCQPSTFDITADVKGGADNQITIISNHLSMNELGTGGLLGPVAVCIEK